MRKHNIKYYPTDNSIIIPHYNVDDKLIGIRSRSLAGSDIELFGKYRPAIINGKMYNHPLSFALYGLNWNKQQIKKIRKAIIFEGE